MASYSCSRLISLPKSRATNWACSKSIWSFNPAITPRPISFPITEFGFSPILSAKVFTFTVSGISIIPSSFFSSACFLLTLEVFLFLDFFFLFFFLGFCSSSSKSSSSIALAIFFLWFLFSFLFDLFLLGFFSSFPPLSSSKYSFIISRSEPPTIDMWDFIFKPNSSFNSLTISLAAMLFSFANSYTLILSAI